MQQAAGKKEVQANANLLKTWKDLLHFQEM